MGLYKLLSRCLRKTPTQHCLAFTGETLPLRHVAPPHHAGPCPSPTRGFPVVPGARTGGGFGLECHLGEAHRNQEGSRAVSPEGRRLGPHFSSESSFDGFDGCEGSQHCPSAERLALVVQQCYRPPTVRMLLLHGAKRGAQLGQVKQLNSRSPPTRINPPTVQKQ